MMDTILRFKSRQGGAFTTTLNKVDFDIPEGVYDFSKSFIELDTRYSRCVFPLPAGGDGVWNTRNCVVPFRVTPRGNNARRFAPATYVRRCRLMCDNQGILEDIDRVDVLRNSLQVYEKDADGIGSLEYKTPTQASSSNSTYSPFRKLNYLGDIASTTQDERIIIRLSDLFELGKETMMPMDRSHLGKAQISLDLELDNISVVAVPGDITGVVGGTFPMAARTSLVATVPGGQTIAAQALVTVPFPVRTNAQDEYDQLYVGAAVTITASAGITYVGGIEAGGEFVITKIEKGPAPVGSYFPSPGVAPLNCLLITFDKGINTGIVAAAATIGIDIVLAAPTTAPAPTYMEAQLVLQRINSPVGAVGNLSYMTFTCEQHSTSLTRMNQQMVVEPNAINIFIANSPTIADLPFSICTNLNDYRLAVNSRPIIPRTIQIAQAQYFNTLHWELLSQAFINGAMRLDSLLECCGDTEQANPTAVNRPYTVGVHLKSLLIGAPLPITNGMKLLQVEINNETVGGGPIGNLQLFKQIVRQIAF